MLNRLSLGLVTASVLAATLSPVTGTAEASTATAASARRGVTVTASAAEVAEGDRLKVTARIRKSAEAGRVTLQRWTENPDGEPGWEDVKTKSARNRMKVKFKVVATALNTERYRASLTYVNGGAAKSQPTIVTVWRWIPLSNFEAYYETPFGNFGELEINGHNYNGYYSYGNRKSWEAKFTPGRHCSAFRGILGVHDSSEDGSSGRVKLTAEDTVIYESPPLTPGTELPVLLPIALPYRFGFQLFDISPDKIDAWPVIADPALLCTGTDTGTG